MSSASNSRTWPVRLLKPALLIAVASGADRLTHVLGYQPCLITSLAESLSPILGLSEESCFALLVLFAIYSVFALTRAVAGLLTAHR